MKAKYEQCKKEWNQIFKEIDIQVPDKKETGNVIFDQGLDWLSEDTKSVLDFGCGNGSVLFYLALRGTKHHIGIDLSEEGIHLAFEREKLMEQGEFHFMTGSIEKMKELADGAMDAVVLSNIIDNLYPKDAMEVIKEVARIVHKDGKVLVKVNPYLTKEEQEEQGINVVEGNLLDDGLLLWNNSTKEWIALFEQYFTVEKQEEIYYEEYKMYNRMFLLRMK
ncbi:hypothetical protein lbkm_2201 [Lachnospiraceae bacterium KM106-2]|nr:hypothetical protein lbkm_2201 [Lachnospiraceae bacterium KM106-2]